MKCSQYIILGNAYLSEPAAACGLFKNAKNECHEIIDPEMDHTFDELSKMVFGISSILGIWTVKIPTIGALIDSCDLQLKDPSINGLSTQYKFMPKNTQQQHSMQYYTTSKAPLFSIVASNKKVQNYLGGSDITAKNDRQFIIFFFFKIISQ